MSDTATAPRPILLYLHDESARDPDTLRASLGEVGEVISEPGDEGIDLAVLDLAGEAVDGALASLAADSLTASAPALVLTRDDGAAARAAGADVVVPATTDAATVRELARAWARAGVAETGLERWRRVFDSLPHGVALVDHEDRLVVANAAYAKLIGREGRELSGQPAIPLLPGAEEPAGGWPPTAARRSGRVVAGEIKAGSRRLQVVASPLSDELGAVVGSVVEVRRGGGDDEGPSIDLLVREHTARLEAESASRMKDEFLSNLSHELRTPLNAIVGWVNLVRAGVDEETTERALASIERNAEIQTELIQEIVDFSGLITGSLEIDPRATDFDGVLEDALPALRHMAEAKGVILETSVGEDLDTIHADPDRLAQVVSSLVSNAIQFSNQGDRVDLAAERTDGGLRITVEDTGIGIGPELLPTIFERFRRSDVSTTRRHGGLGLGLAIARRLVELHGGTVTATSEGAGKGATFTVEMPQRPRSALQSAARGAKPTKREPLPADGHWPSLEGIRILVIDDAIDSLQVFEETLTSCGAQVDAVATVPEALESFRRNQPDIVLSDLGLPGADGFELIRRLRRLRSGAGGSVPAAALTAYAGSGDRQRALEAGFDAHVSKPVKPQELVAVAARLAGRSPAST